MINITNVSRARLSKNAGYTQSIISFMSNVDILKYRIVKGGTGYDSGEIIEEVGNTLAQFATSGYLSELVGNTLQSMSMIAARTILQKSINVNGLDEGDNRINIYGQHDDESWDSYE